MLLLKLFFLGFSLPGCLELQHWIGRSTLMPNGLWAHWIKLWHHSLGLRCYPWSCSSLEKCQVYKAISKYILAEIWFSHRQNLIASHQARFEPSTPDLPKPMWCVLIKARAITVHTQRNTGHPTPGPAQWTSGPPLGYCLGAPEWWVRVTLAVLAMHLLIQRRMIPWWQLGRVPGANWHQWPELHLGYVVTMESWGRNSFWTSSAWWFKNSLLVLWGESLSTRSKLFWGQTKALRWREKSVVTLAAHVLGWSSAGWLKLVFLDTETIFWFCLASVLPCALLSISVRTTLEHVIQSEQLPGLHSHRNIWSW